jgi:DNA-binding FadR family transcriptional regulator
VLPVPGFLEVSGPGPELDEERAVQSSSVPVPEVASAAAPGSFKALPRQRAFRQIVDQIEAAIMDGRLRPGDRLPPERELARTFGVARSTVLESVRSLERFGVVASRAGRGRNSGLVIGAGAGPGLACALVLATALGRVPAQDTAEARVMLETHAVALACKAGGAWNPEELARIIESGGRASGAEDLYRHDTAFHAAVARISGNEILAALVEALQVCAQRDILRRYAQDETWQRLRTNLAARHARILDRIVAGDVAAATAEMQADIAESATCLPVRA